MTSNATTLDAICNDANGFCVAARGSMDPKTSGVYTSLLRLASQLEGQDAPLIVIETTKGNIMVKEYDGHAVALRMPPKDAEVTSS